MKFQIVKASVNKPVDIVIGNPGTSLTLRAQLAGEILPRGISMKWVATPSNFLASSGVIYKPDYLRKFTVKGEGSLYAVLLDSNGNTLALSQVVKFVPSPAEYEGSQYARTKAKSKAKRGTAK